MQGGFASFALVLAVVLTFAAVSGTAYLFRQAFLKPISTPSPQVLAVTELNPFPEATPIPTEDPYASWQSYSDSAFSFKYPEGWVVSDGSSEKLGHLVIVKNPEGNVWIKLTDKKQVFEFGAVGSWKTSEIKLSVEGKEYATHEAIVNRTGVFVDLIVGKNEKSYQILFGTGYPATTGVAASLNTYNEVKDTILKILLTLKIGN